MTVHVKNLEADPYADSFSHPLDERPYRMVVFSGFDQNHVPVYWVAGTSNAVMNAKNALSAAIKHHEGHCFFCAKTDKLTIDHAIPISRGGTDALSNLLVSCEPCNKKKSAKPIETHDPVAARRWLKAIMAQNRQRLDRINGSQN
jgi:HNH endonuclease